MQHISNFKSHYDVKILHIKRTEGTQPNFLELRIQRYNPCLCVAANTQNWIPRSEA